MSDTDIDRQRLELDRQKFRQEAEFRARELSLEEQKQADSIVEYKSKEREARLARWWNPLVLAIIGAALAAAGNAVVAFMNRSDQLKLEAQQEESARILAVVKTADPDKAATNLGFLVDTGLITNKRTTESLRRYLATRGPGQGISLGEASQSGGHDPNSLNRLTEKCVQHWTSDYDPSPCVLVDLEGGTTRGFALFKDIVGTSRYMLIPTTMVDGIGDPHLLAANAPNYWRFAWAARHFVSLAAKQDISPDRLAVAVNSSPSSSQNLLHMFVDCLSDSVRSTVAAHQDEIGQTWKPLKEKLNGKSYMARRISGNVLSVNPFWLLADGLPTARADMRSQNMVLTEVEKPDATYDFVLLNRADGAFFGDSSAAEALLSNCPK